MQIIHTKSGYATTRSLEIYFNTIFLPALHELRNRYEYYGKVVLIIDGYGPHHIALDQIDFSRENLIIHYLPPHASDQMQPLDLEVFGILKRYANNFKNNREDSYMTQQIRKVVDALYKACTPENCKSAFTSIGIEGMLYNIDGEIIEMASFNLEKCSKIRFYQISYIYELIQNIKPLSQNQFTIFDNYNYPINDLR